MTRRRSPVRRRRSDAAADDRGSLSVFVVGLAVMLFLLAGLVIDGGQAINSRMRAADEAEEAARSAANEISEASLRSGGAPVIAEDAARATVAAYANATGDQMSVTFPSPREVTVTVTTHSPLTLLALIFQDDFTVSASATARTVQGITAEVP
jgi:hypothetical protein